jgi:hypothetical protein
MPICLDRDAKMRVAERGLSLRREASVAGILRNVAVSALTVAALAIGAGGEAAALTFEDIVGKWCGSVSSYTFTQSRLIVVLYADNSRREYKVDDYQYEDDAVTVNWQRDGDKLFTKFSEFSSDNKRMAQQQNNAGPRREFKRCS